MDTINQFFQSLFQIALCVSPFLIIGLIIGGVVFYNNWSKQQRSERLTVALQGTSGLTLPTLSVPSTSDGNQSDPLVDELANCSQFFAGLTRGEVNIFEQRSLHRSVQALQAYRQRAAYGTLPSQELEQLRSVELQRIDALGAGITHLTQAAETGNADALRQYLQDASGLLTAAYEGHLSFLLRLRSEGIAFPMQPPAPIVTTSSNITPIHNSELVPVQILQQLPQDKQAFFMMQYDSVKKTPTTAVLLAVLLGGVGAHKFYLGQVGLGILYLVFSWTWIPMILGFIEAFTISGYVNRQNAQKAMEIAAMLKGGHI